jgi:ABC-2 type transport system permease protein
VSTVTPPFAIAPVLPMLWRQTWAQLVTTWRIPAFTVSGLALPVILFSFFGLPYVDNHLGNGISVGAYLLASFGAYSVSSVMVFSFGIGVATDRGQKLDSLMRATPLPPAVYLGGRVITALVFGLISLTILLAFGTIVGGVRLGADIWLTLIARLLVGSLPFIGLGFAIGYLAGPNAAPGVVN